MSRGVLFTQVALTLPLKNNTANYIQKSSSVLFYGISWTQCEYTSLLLQLCGEKIQCKNPKRKYVTMGTVVS